VGLATLVRSHLATLGTLVSSLARLKTHLTGSHLY
jgi:hypothetical protein